MTKPRRELVSLGDTPYYHCVSRCVRRAFLCGDDHYSGRDYSHRKEWVKERLAVLSGVFAIELCAYAVMSNHYHLVVCIRRETADAWTDDEVIDRWRRLFKGPPIVQRYAAGDALSVAEQSHLAGYVPEWRRRLTDISWYMRCLNEHLARRANREDEVSGRFWEGRFKCQALLDETALITAMAYVDLNPVRAGLTKRLEESHDTSVKQRLEAITLPEMPGAVPLKAFVGSERGDDTDGLPFNFQDYLALVDWSGRTIRDDKCGVIDQRAPRLLDVLGISDEEWLPTVTALQRRFELVMGSPRRMRQRARAAGRSFYRGCRSAERLYRRA
jgi:putative transposase